MRMLDLLMHIVTFVFFAVLAIYLGIPEWFAVLICGLATIFPEIDHLIWSIKKGRGVVGFLKSLVLHKKAHHLFFHHIAFLLFLIILTMISIGSLPLLIFFFTMLAHLLEDFAWDFIVEKNIKQWLKL